MSGRVVIYLLSYSSTSLQIGINSKSFVFLRLRKKNLYMDFEINLLRVANLLANRMMFLGHLGYEILIMDLIWSRFTFILR